MLGLVRRIVIEAVGTAILLAAVVGSGIMAEQLSGGNMGVALLANAIATGAVLYGLIGWAGPISGAHFNPVVSAVMVLDGGMRWRGALAYAGAQVAGGIAGVLLAHLMFDVPVLQVSDHARIGVGLFIAEIVATFGLVTTILMTVRERPQAVPASVALYIVAAYWFTSSTSFANPAATIARSLTDTFAGIAPLGIAWFILAQIIGGLAGWSFCRLFAKR